MEISKKKILTSSAGRCVTDQFTLEEDYNVPDNRDDIGRVIACDGSAVIGEIKKTDSYLTVTGKIDFKVLYVTDSVDPGLSSLEGTLPISSLLSGTL